MIASPQALDLGYAALANLSEREKSGDIVVELVRPVYRVRFFFVISENRQLDHLVEVSLDPDSGRVIKSEDKGKVAGLEGRSAESGWEKFLSAKRAFDLAVAANKGFQTFDKNGRLTVLLHKDIYCVTFPVIPPRQPGSEGADFAVQVSISARSGEVLERLIGG
jgi:hypothetical protein